MLYPPDERYSSKYILKLSRSQRRDTFSAPASPGVFELSLNETRNHETQSQNVINVINESNSPVSTQSTGADSDQENIDIDESFQENKKVPKDVSVEVIDSQDVYYVTW